MAAVADAIVLGVGARLIQTGHLTSERSSRSCSTSTYSSHPSSSSRRCSIAWQQTRVVGGSNRRAEATRSLTPIQRIPRRSAACAGDVSLNHVRFSYPCPPSAPDSKEGARLLARAAGSRLLQSRRRRAGANHRRRVRGIDLQSRQGDHRPRRRNGCREIHSHESCCTFLTTPMRGALRSTGTTCAPSICTTSAISSATFRRRHSSLSAPSGTTSRTGARGR